MWSQTRGESKEFWRRMSSRDTETQTVRVREKTMLSADSA